MKKHPGRQRRLDESKVEMRKLQAVAILSQEDPRERMDRNTAKAYNFAQNYGATATAGEILRRWKERERGE